MTLPPAADAPLESFGPYDVYEELGTGGMASVHRAMKRGIAGFQRSVALKRLLEPLAEDKKFIDSFVREARLASYLHHANIIQIYDLGRVEQVYFIAMELVRGNDLRGILKQTAYATGPMPVPLMLYITRQVCDALEYAHHLTDDKGQVLGLLHRDISPSNLLIANDGHLKIIDFGIAKAAPSSLATQSGRLKGKFAYMAPEVIRGHSFEHRSDLFAVGVVAYEMLTARPLFASKNEYETLRRITKVEVPPPSTINPNCPKELDQVVLRALAKKPAERWTSAGEMLSALDFVAKSHSLGATNRDVAEWVQWAFQQPLRPGRVSHRPSGPAPAPAAKQAPKTSKQRASAPARAKASPSDPAVDAASINNVWSEKQESLARPSQKLTAQIASAYAAGMAALAQMELPEVQVRDYSQDVAGVAGPEVATARSPVVVSQGARRPVSAMSPNSQASALDTLIDDEEPAPAPAPEPSAGDTLLDDSFVSSQFVGLAARPEMSSASARQSLPRQSGPAASQGSGAMPSYGTGPTPSGGTGPAPSYGSGPVPVRATGPAPAYSTGSRPYLGSGGAVSQELMTLTEEDEVSSAGESQAVMRNQVLSAAPHQTSGVPGASHPGATGARTSHTILWLFLIVAILAGSFAIGYFFLK